MSERTYASARTVSDALLTQEARGGSRSAFTALLTRHQGFVYRLALRMCRNVADAEEVVQETFLHAYRGIGAFQGTSQCSTWLYRIVVNEVLMRRRAASRRPVESGELAPESGCSASVGGDPEEGAEDVLDRKVIMRHVLAALARLDEDHRLALVLRDLEELSAEEAANILGVTPDVVRQRASRARSKLRLELGSLRQGCAARLGPP